MAVQCDPASLMAASKCLACLTPKQQAQVTAYAVFVLAGLPTDKNGVSAAMAASKCFSCATPVQIQQLIAWALCQIGQTVGA